jgi:hypothetical protein
MAQKVWFLIGVELVLGRVLAEVTIYPTGSTLIHDDDNYHKFQNSKLF